jgi:hypothetical protein
LALEKEWAERKEALQKREDQVLEKEQILSDLQLKVEQFPEELKRLVEEAEERLRAQILQEHGFETQIQQKERDGFMKFHDLQVASLQGKIKELEILVKDSSQKAEKASEAVQLIACRALDASSQRFMAAPSAPHGDDKGNSAQK